MKRYEPLELRTQHIPLARIPCPDCGEPAVFVSAVDKAGVDLGISIVNYVAGAVWRDQYLCKRCGKRHEDNRHPFTLDDNWCAWGVEGLTDEQAGA